MTYLQQFYHFPTKIYIFFILLSSKFLSPLSHYLCSLLSLPSLSHLLSPLFIPKHHPPPNINITVVHSFWRVAIRVLFCVMVFFFFFSCDQCLKEKVGMAGFLGCSDWWWIWWRSMWVTGFRGDWRAWVTGFGGARRGSLGLVEIGALPLSSLLGKAKILLSNLLAPLLYIAKGLPHPKLLLYIENLGELPIVIITLLKFPNGKSLGSLSQSLTLRRTASLSCATTFLCRLIGFGGDQHGSSVAGFLLWRGFFFLFFFF